MHLTKNQKNQKMKYYAFDWDDNILFMPTLIHMQQLIDDKWIDEDVSTSKYAEIRTLDNWRVHEKSYIEFQDFGEKGDNTFLNDCITAINNKAFGPSWYIFLHSLSNGSLFAIITARGHEHNSIKKVIQYIIDNVLTSEQKTHMIANLIAYKDLFISDFNIIDDIEPDMLIEQYLDLCDFIGISSPSFETKYGVECGVENPEKLKILALNDFINKINSYGKELNSKVRLGFSDDDIRNIDKVEEHFSEISGIYDIDFSIFDTSNPKKIIKKKKY